MKTFRRTTVGVGLLFAATLAAAGGPSVASKPHAPEKEDLVSLERVVPRLMKDGDVPGLSLAVVRDGQVVYRPKLRSPGHGHEHSR